MILVEWWCKYIGDFRDDRSKRALKENDETFRLIIRAVSPVVTWAIGREDSLGLRGMVAWMRNGARNLTVLQTILEVDWSGTFNGKVVLNTGAYLYYDYQTDRVDGYPAWKRSGRDVFPTIEPRFVLGQLSTLAGFEVEVPIYMGEDRRSDQDDRNERAKWEAEEERSVTVSALWRNVFKAAGMEVLRNAGEAVDFITTVLRGTDGFQDEIRQLRVQNAQLRTLVSEANRRVTTAQAVTTRDLRERDAYQQTSREARDEVDNLSGQ